MVQILEHQELQTLVEVVVEQEQLVDQVVVQELEVQAVQD
jgi:hypothetical protein